MTDRRAVVLLSGGLDSSTTLAIAQQGGFIVHALTVRYGQRHSAEIAASEKIARAMSVAEHRFMDVDLRPAGIRWLGVDR
jgi:7-cyano-7-deazaguanine synthase